ncbi:MAG: zinc-ribbon domain-containing protein [Rhodospirillales bacterium]|nr:zinc-ribbon domain-containing protein [Rhodospirillales bacterium]
MIISCPVCAQQYNMDPATLGAEGKLVRCSNCGNKWRATESMAYPPPPPPAAQEQVVASPRYMPSAFHQPQPPAPQQGYYQAPMQAAPMPGYAPQQPGQPYYPPQEAPMPPEGMQPQQPTAPEPAPAPIPEPEAEPEAEPFEFEEDEDDFTDDVASSIDSMFDEDDDDENDFIDEDDDAGEDLPTPEELDAMFAGDEDPAVMESFVDNQDGEAMEFMDPDDIPDEPVPDVFTQPLTKKPESSGGLVKFLMISLLIIGGLGAGLFYGKEAIIGMVPEAEELYEMAGLVDKTPGAGLEFKDIKSERDEADGKDFLVVWGAVVNITDQPRVIPKIRVSLYDARNEEVQFIEVKPTKPNLEASGTLGFKARLADPVPTARRMEVTFSEEEIEMEEEMEKE